MVVLYFNSISCCKAAIKKQKMTGDKIVRKQDKWGDRGMTGTGFLWRTTYNRLRSVTAEKWPVWSHTITLFPSTGLNEFVISRATKKQSAHFRHIVLYLWPDCNQRFVLFLTLFQHFCKANVPPSVTNITCCGLPTHHMRFSAVQGLLF